MSDLTLPECLRILLNSFAGFQLLLTKFGALSITANQIGIDDEGMCKVWLNQNLSLNQSAYPSTSNTKHIIMQIIQAVQSQASTETQYFFKKLNKQIHQFKVTFQTAQSFLLLFASQFSITVPNNLVRFIPASLKSTKSLNTVKISGPWNRQSIKFFGEKQKKCLGILNPRKDIGNMQTSAGLSADSQNDKQKQVTFIMREIGHRQRNFSYSQPKNLLQVPIFMPRRLSNDTIPSESGPQLLTLNGLSSDEVMASSRLANSQSEDDESKTQDVPEKFLAAQIMQTNNWIPTLKSLNCNQAYSNAVRDSFHLGTDNWVDDGFELHKLELLNKNVTVSITDTTPFE